MTTIRELQEKAKAYDEALEKARKLYNEAKANGYTSDMEDYESIFPALADSEDERIRKVLVELVKCNERSGYFLLNNVTTSSMLTWLEKQKEQKPVHTAKEMWKEMRLEVYAQASGNRHEPNYSDDSTKMFSLCDIDEIFDKIGDSTVSSQPAEWSEDFESNIRTLLHDKLTWHSEDGSMSSTVFIDDKTLKDIVRGIWFYVGKEAIKYPNKELDTAEWSEEDEEMHKACIAFIADEKFKGYEKSYECIDWLKSLRPRSHWKPSEEQMNALLNLRFFGQKIGPSATLAALDDLYEQLKQL